MIAGASAATLGRSEYSGDRLNHRDLAVRAMPLKRTSLAESGHSARQVGEGDAGRDASS
jgi:hypothetical protein